MGFLGDWNGASQIGCQTGCKKEMWKQTKLQKLYKIPIHQSSRLSTLVELPLVWRDVGVDLLCRIIISDKTVSCGRRRAQCSQSVSMEQPDRKWRRKKDGVIQRRYVFCAVKKTENLCVKFMFTPQLHSSFTPLCSIVYS